MNEKNISQEELRLLVEHEFLNRFNHTSHVYIDITGDLVAGTLLSQIIYWFTPSKDKKSKLRVFKNGYYWLVKRREDWYPEIRISSKQFDTAIKKLIEKKFVEVQNYKFNGSQTKHIRLLYENINPAIAEWKTNIAKEICGEDCEIPEWDNLKSPNKEVHGNAPMGNFQIPSESTSITENTTETTFNREYNTENTDKYAFSDKSSKVDNIYASVSEKQEEEPKPKKKSRYIPKDYTEEQLIEHIKPVIDNYIDNNCERRDKDELKNNLLEIISEFHREYEKKFGEKHRILADVSYENIAERFLNPPDILDTVYDVESYSAMIEQYFIVEFNKRKKYKKPIEISLSHFMSDEIRGHLYWQTCV